MISYNLALKLKKAGFPQKHDFGIRVYDSQKEYYFNICNSDDYDQTGKPPFKNNQSSGLEDRYIYIPTLEELIDECGDNFGSLERDAEDWIAFAIGGRTGKGENPCEAVANLYLEINKKI